MKPRRLFHLSPHDPRGLIVSLATDLDLPIVGLCGRRLSYPVEERRTTSKDCRRCRRAAETIREHSAGDHDLLPSLWWN